VLEDVFQMVAGYCDALSLAFVFIDVLLVSCHVTRTCLSAHALWTERQSYADEVCRRRGSGVPAVVVPTEATTSVRAECDGDVEPRLSTAGDVAPTSAMSNHSTATAELCQYYRPQAACNDEKSPQLKAKRSFYTVFSRPY